MSEKYDLIKMEKNVHRYDDEIIKKIITIYNKPEFKELLWDVSRCNECIKINTENDKIPINLLCNYSDDIEQETERLNECEISYGRLITKLRQQYGRKIDEGDFRKFFTEAVLGEPWNGFGAYGKGISIGLHPWADYSLSYWDIKKPRCDILVIGQDWYTLHKTLINKSIFTWEYHEESQTWLNFWSELLKNVEFKGNTNEFFKSQLRDHQFFFTNAMLCLRRGIKNQGSDNFDSKSITRCKKHLLTQIQILKPKVIIPMAVSAHPKVKSIFKNNWRIPTDRPDYWKLTRSPWVLNGQSEFGKMYDKYDDFIGLPCAIDSNHNCHIIPIYHSSRIDDPDCRYDNDYALIARALDKLG